MERKLERRAARISGELTNGQWQTLGRNLGRMGLDFTFEDRTDPTETASRKDFLDFAAEHDLSPKLAIKAYSELVLRFQCKHFRSKAGDANWQHRWLLNKVSAEQAQNYPVVFRTFPSMEKRFWLDRDRALVTDLEMDSLAEYVRLIDNSITRNGAKVGIPAVVGEGVGLKIFTFWKDFTQERLAVDSAPAIDKK